MAEWTQCPSCQLKHVARADGSCPRCGQPVAVLAAPAWGSLSAPGHPVAPQAFVPGASAPHAFTVSRFLESVFRTWGRNAGSLIPLALLLHAPVALAMYQLYTRLPSKTSAPDELGWFVGLLAAGGVMLLVFPLELVAFAQGGLRRLRDEPVTLGDMLRAGGRAYFPALGLVLLVGLAYLGTFCTIVLPLFLLTGWAASVPAMTAEGLGPIRALSRSWALTRGLRWEVFAGFLVVILAAASCACVVQMLVSVVLIGGGALAGGGDPERMLSSLGGVQAVNMLVQGIQSSLVTTATAVAYHQLRVATEGPGSSHLARVFE